MNPLRHFVVLPPYRPGNVIAYAAQDEHLAQRRLRVLHEAGVPAVYVVSAGTRHDAARVARHVHRTAS